MQQYKILGADGKEYGPVTAEVLRQWIAQGRANEHTSVQAEGSAGWKPLSSYPEFADAFTGSSVPGIPPLSTAPATSVGPARTSRLAIASSICGILGFLCLPALAGIVLGIMALARIRKSEKQLKGKGLAIVGISLSCLMGLFVVPAEILITLAKAMEKAPRVNCANNMKQIGLAMRVYSMDNNELYPTNFQSMSNELSTPKVLWCPADRNHVMATDWPVFYPPKHLSYDYLKPGIAASNALNKVIVRCPIHNNVLMGDGSVQMPKPGQTAVPGLSN
jgi:hypothetical protein